MRGDENAQSGRSAEHGPRSFCEKMEEGERGDIPRVAGDVRSEEQDDDEVTMSSECKLHSGTAHG